MALCIAAFICGRQNLTQIHCFARGNPDLPGPLGFGRRRAPSVPELSRVLGPVAPQALQAALSQGLGALIEHGRHYVFQVKAGQPALLEKMKLVFSPKLTRRARVKGLYPKAFCPERIEFFARSPYQTAALLKGAA